MINQRIAAKSGPDKVSTISDGTNTESDIYDAGGTLLLQTNSATGSTLFNGADELHVAAGSSTVTGTRMYVLDGVAIAERTTKAGVGGNVLLWLISDAQSTVNLEVDAITGTLTYRAQDPFGNSRDGSPTWSDDRGYLDAPTSRFSGLTVLGARLYDSTIGKFLSVDPVLEPFEPRQNNGYAYAHNNPVTKSDPAGTDPPPALSCNTKACRDESYTGTTPHAAGNEIYVAITPHFGVQGSKAYIHGLQKGMAALQKSLGVKTIKNESQETGLWWLYCVENTANGCSPQLRLQIYEGDQADMGFIATNSVFFFSGPGGSFAVDPYANGGDAEATVRHYTSSDAAKSIKLDGSIAPSERTGETFLTSVEYPTAAEAQAMLALPKSPEGFFSIKVSRVFYASPESVVVPRYNQPGGGLEFTTTEPIDVGDVDFIPFGE